MSKKAQAALNILKEGGYFWVSEGRGYYGKLEAKYQLIGADKKVVKGFGIQTMRELEDVLDRKQDKFGFDFGIYRLASS